MSGVAEIVADVRARGDEAVREWSLRLDGVEPRRAEPGGELPEQAVLDLARRVRLWHEAQRPADVRLEVEPGVELERRWLPLGSVGIYVPRGLVSTLVMTAVPAQAAGVERIVVVTPPAGAALVAAAAGLLGVDEVWAVGGPQAVAALAYGTETIPRVDKIVGPGNAYVNEAKLLVSRDVAIDLPAGPSEWLLRVTPAAGFAVQQPYPQYPQVTAIYSALSGYFPLAPWTGFAVLCGWTAVALAGAAYLLRRRDA